MSNSLQTTFPTFNVPENKKDEAWYKQCVESITNRSLNQTYTLNYTLMNESVNFFQGVQVGDEYNFLQQAEDGEVLPAKWMNINRIMSKLKIVIGEFMEKGYDIRVRALNKEAVSRRLKEKDRLLSEMRMQPLAEELEGQTGMPFQTGEQLPQDEEDLEDYIESSYKETSEVVVEGALKWLAKMYTYDIERAQMFRDILIMGRCFAKVELCDGLPRIRRVDPRLMIFDTNATDDLLTDSTYWGEVQFMPLAEVTEKYNLDKKEIDEVFNSGKNGDFTSFVNGVMPDFPLTKDNDIIYYKQEGGELRVLVVTAYWLDTKPFNQKETVDKHGNVHIKRVPDSYQENKKDKKEKLTKKRVQTWRKGTLIGGKIVRDYGEMENQGRDSEYLGKAYAPYFGLCPFFYNGTTISLTHQLKALQDLKNIFAYNIQLACAKAGTKSLVYDLAQIPEGWTEETVLKWLKTVGIVFINSKVDGTPSQFNQFSEIDLSISSTMEQYIKLIAWVDQEMNAVSGINEAREGITQGASQAVGVTQAALFQSNLATAPYFKMFKAFADRCLTHQARLVKTAWVGKERFAPIIGDVGVDFLKEDIDVDLNDYGVFIEEVPPMINDLQMYSSFITAALQAGALDFEDALDLSLERDITVGVRRYKRAIAKKRKEEMARIQQEQQVQAEQMQQQMEAQAELQQRKDEAVYNQEMIKGENSLQQLLAKGKIDLTGKKLDLLKDVKAARPSK